MDIYKNRFTITITDVSILEKLDALSKSLNIPKSKIINLLLKEFLDDFIEKLQMKDSQQHVAGGKTQGGGDDENALLKSILDYLNVGRINTLINQRMLGSIYQHLVLLMGTMPGLPTISVDLKNKFDHMLPPNFADLKEEYLAQLFDEPLDEAMRKEQFDD